MKNYFVLGVNTEISNFKILTSNNQYLPRGEGPADTEPPVRQWTAPGDAVKSGKLTRSVI